VDVVLADAELTGDLACESAHVAAGRHGLVFMFRLGERATWRPLATRPAGTDRAPFGQPGPPVPAAELQKLLTDAPHRPGYRPTPVTSGPRRDLFGWLLAGRPGLDNGN
jgi:hypothetical protein